MTVWIAIAALAALAALALSVPLWRRVRAARRARYDLAVYRDQLAEIDRDAERGLLTLEEAESSRVEIQRRMLAAVDNRGEGGERNEAPEPSGRGRWAVLAVVLLAPLGALVFYAQLGSPQTPDYPFATRTDRDTAPAMAAADADQVKQMIARLEARLDTNPDDAEGWRLLGRSYLALQRHEMAAEALRKAAQLSGTPDARGEYAEALVLANGGQVTDDALGIFRENLRRDPYAPKARFFVGLARAQGGDVAGALQTWIDLVFLSPPDAQWLPVVRSQIVRAAEAIDVDPATIEPSDMARRLADMARARSTGNGAAPAPSAEDMETFRDMSPEEQEQMIRGMVQRLADRLEQDPQDPQGWRRLARAYEVLGEPEKAAEARRRADELAP